MLERVKEIIQEQLNLDGVEITEESSFKDDLGADSLDLFELVTVSRFLLRIWNRSQQLEQLSST